MGVLKNIKHENFAQGIAKGMSQDAAYTAAGYKQHRGNASTLRSKQNVIDRIAELSAAAAERAAKTLDEVIAEYERVAFTGMSRFLRVDADGNPQINLCNCTEADLDLISEATMVVRREVARSKGQGEDKKPDDEVLTIKIKPLDRLKALEKLGMYLDMGDKSSNQTTDRLADALREISKRGSMAPMRKLKNRGKISENLA